MFVSAFVAGAKMELKMVLNAYDAVLETRDAIPERTMNYAFSKLAACFDLPSNFWSFKHPPWSIDTPHHRFRGVLAFHPQPFPSLIANKEFCLLVRVTRQWQRRWFSQMFPAKTSGWIYEVKIRVPNGTLQTTQTINRIIKHFTTGAQADCGTRCIFQPFPFDNRQLLVGATLEIRRYCPLLTFDKYSACN